MTPKENAIKLIEELKVTERKLFLQGKDTERFEIVQKIEKIRSMFGIEGEYNDGICESCQ